MSKNYSNQSLSNQSFSGQSLANTNFEGSDIRGADFSLCDLSGSNFSKIQSGITPKFKTLMFSIALVLSLFASYIAMLGSSAIQQMLKHPDVRIHYVAMVVIALVFLFFAFVYWKGIGLVKYFMLGLVGFTILFGVVMIMIGAGTGRGAIIVSLVFVLVTAFFLIATVARAIAGALSSNILFIIVAVSGGLFGKSLGTGIGTTILAIGCGLISKRALSGTKGFENMRKFVLQITNRFGTSFKDTKLNNVNFSGAHLNNVNFIGADVRNVNWDNAQKTNCIEDTP